MNYLALFAPLAFIAAVQLGVKYGAKPSTCASVAVVLPFVVSAVARWIYLAGFDLPVLPTIFSVASVAMIICQFAVAMYFFAKLQAVDGYVAWLGWVIGGGVSIVYVIPAVIAMLFR